MGYSQKRIGLPHLKAGSPRFLLLGKGSGKSRDPLRKHAKWGKLLKVDRRLPDGGELPRSTAPNGHQHERWGDRAAAEQE